MVVSDNEPVISVNFPGGTVAEYVAMLRKASQDKPINIVYSERAGKQQLSQISLKDVPLSVAAQAIQTAATATTGDWMINSISPPSGAGESYSVVYEPSRRQNEAFIIEAISLQRILGASVTGHDAEGAAKTALTAIETGLALQNAARDNPPELKYHPESGMLFVRGQSPDVHLVTQIISRLSDDAERRHVLADRETREQKMTALAVKEAQLELQMAEMEMGAAEKMYNLTQAQVEKGAEGQSALTHHALELGRARMNLERAKINVERAQLQIPREGGRTGAAEVAADSAQLLAIIDSLKAQNKQLNDQLVAQKRGAGDDGSRTK
jgi:hypothetical protein